MIFSGGFKAGNFGLTVVTIISSLLSVVYALRFVGLIFFKKSDAPLELEKPMVWALVSGLLLVALLIVSGIFPGLMLDWTQRGLLDILGGIL
jgi:NADH:ubiquinone oxidoreductase subunit 2 (subunit N)